jgi:hypothetical protein
MDNDGVKNNGCQTLRELWKVAEACNIEDPGIVGTPGRLTNFVQCNNVNKFMSMATMKCWEERKLSSFPPLVLEEVKKVFSSGSSHSSDKSSSKK